MKTRRNLYKRRTRVARGFHRKTNLKSRRNRKTRVVRGGIFRGFSNKVNPDDKNAKTHQPSKSIVGRIRSALSHHHEDGDGAETTFTDIQTAEVVTSPLVKSVKSMINSNSDNKYSITIKYKNNDVYNGELKDDKCTTGFFNKATGKRFDYKNCIKDGVGTMHYANGDKYVGNWKDNKRADEGVMTYANGDKYNGNWKDNKMEGKGIYTFKNKDVYDFNWADNRMKGQGKIIYENGDVYEGNIKKHFYIDIYVKDQYGKMTYATGDKYDGEWFADERAGKGVMTYANGDKYDGYWSNDERSGKGKMTWSNGNVYDGSWLNGKMHGKGVMTYKTGYKIMRNVWVIMRDGIWKNNNFVDSERYIMTYKDEKGLVHEYYYH